MSTEQPDSNQSVHDDSKIVEITDIEPQDIDAESPTETKTINEETQLQKQISKETSADENAKTVALQLPDTESQNDSSEPKFDTAKSFRRAMSNTVRYKRPRSVSTTHLKDTIQPGYILTWFVAMFFSTMAVVGDWAIVRALDVNICAVDDNYDSDLLSVDFLSWNSIAGLIQQLWLIIICLGLFVLGYLPHLVGVDLTDSKVLRNSRIKLFCVILVTQVIVNIFLVPLAFNFRSIFNVITLFLFFPWGYYETQCVGIRRFYPLWAVTFAAVFLYYVLGGMVFSTMPNSTYAFIYPFYLTFSQFVLIKLLEYLDGCKCCKPGVVNEMSLEYQTGSCRRVCMKRCLHWRNTSAINEWPDFWVYYACGLVVCMSESFRLASYVVIKESSTDLLTSFILGMVSEIMTRNMIYKIIWDKYIMRYDKSTPLSRVKAVYLGCKYHTDYIPVLVLVACNVLHFGSTNDCYYSKIAFSMDITNGYEWMIVVFLVYEFFTDMLTYAVYRLMKKFDILTHDAQDKTIKMAIVMLSRTEMFTMMMSLGYWSFVAFIYDDSSRPQQP